MLDRFFEENTGKLLRGVSEISQRSTSQQKARYARPTLESSSDNEDLLDRVFEENAGKLFRGVRVISQRSTSEQRAAHNARYARPTLESSCDNDYGIKR